MTASNAQATTFRLDPRIKAGLQKISDSANVTMNKLVNEALGAYVERRLADEQADLEALLQNLRRYSSQDDQHARAIAAIAGAEASGSPDPAEGVPVGPKATSTERTVLDILNG